MSLFSDFKAIQSFGNALLNNRGYTNILLKLNQERANAIIQGCFDTLQVIKESNPFENCMDLMETQDFQRRFLNKAMHPDLIEEGEELIQGWKTESVEMTVRADLAVTIMFNGDEFPTYFEVGKKTIEQFECDKLGHYYLTNTFSSIKEAFHRQKVQQPDLKELDFTFRRKD